MRRKGMVSFYSKFSGVFDKKTGLYYYGARYLDPRTSRWLSADPALGEYLPSAPVNDEARRQNGNLPGMGGVYNYVNLHVYHYAGNNPVKYVDPDGREVKIVIIINKIDSSAIGKTATGTITVTDLDTGCAAMAAFVSGGKPYGDHIPLGDYNILQPNSRGQYRLEALDSNYGDDAIEGTDQSQIRLHGTGSGRTIGCVSVVGDDNWEKINSLINETSTTVDAVPVLNQWLPWNKGETEDLTNFGTLTVIDRHVDAVTGAASNN
jgi:RHS repeat-associated protein